MKLLYYLIFVTTVFSCKKNDVQPTRTSSTTTQPAKGTYYFYHPDSSVSTAWLEVTVDGINSNYHQVETLANQIDFIPSCHSSNYKYITGTVDTGSYSYHVITLSGNYHAWSGQIQVTKDDCIFVRCE